MNKKKLETVRSLTLAKYLPSSVRIYVPVHVHTLFAGSLWYFFFFWNFVCSQEYSIHPVPCYGLFIWKCHFKRVDENLIDYIMRGGNKTEHDWICHVPQKLTVTAKLNKRCNLSEIIEELFALTGTKQVKTGGLWYFKLW